MRDNGLLKILIFDLSLYIFDNKIYSII